MKIFVGAFVNELVNEIERIKKFLKYTETSVPIPITSTPIYCCKMNLKNIQPSQRQLRMHSYLQNDPAQY